MIFLEIINSPDPEMIGRFQINSNLISLGDSKDNVWLHDQVISNNAMTLEVSEKGLNCHIHADIDFFHVNGKRTKVYKLIKNNDLIKLGNTEFKIIDFEFVYEKTKKEMLEENMEKIINTRPDIVKIIKDLRQMLKDGKELQ